MTDKAKSFYDVANSDEVFLERRDAFIASSERFRKGEFVDHPFLLARRQALTPSLFRIMLFNHLVSILEPYNLNRKVIGFDTFEGFRSLTSDDDARVNEAMFSDTSEADIKNLLALHDINRAVPHVPRGELVKGDACETIPAYVKANPHLMVALLYIDFDIYEPTKVALEHLAPLVPKGGIIAFDEINVARWAGETKAVREYFELNNLKVRRMHFEPYASYAIVGE